MWVNAKTRPKPAMRAALGALLGIPAEKIAKATLPPPPVPRAPIHLPVLETRLRWRLRSLSRLCPHRRRMGCVFMSTPGHGARFTLDATMPVDQAMLLLRILLDAGFVRASSRGINTRRPCGIAQH